MQLADISIDPDPISILSNDDYEAAINRIMVKVLETIYRVSSFRVSGLFVKVSLIMISSFFFQLCAFISFIPRKRALNILTF